MDIRAIDKIMAFAPQLQSESGRQMTFVENTFLAPESSDACLATVVTYLNDKGPEKLKFHLQKLNHDTFEFFFRRPTIMSLAPSKRSLKYGELKGWAIYPYVCRMHLL